MLDIGGAPQVPLVSKPNVGAAPVAPQAPQPMKAAQMKLTQGGQDTVAFVLAVFTLVIACAFYAAFYGLTKGKRDNIKETESQIAVIDKELAIPQNKDFADRLIKYDKQFTLYKTISSKRAYYSRLVGIMLARLPRNATLSSLSIDTNGQVVVEASAPDITAAAKGYVALRDYVSVELTSQNPNPDINKIKAAFATDQKPDVLVVQSDANKAYALFTQVKPDKYYPAQNESLVKALGEWSIGSVTSAFQTLTLNSVSPPNTKQKDTAPKSSFSITFTPQKNLFEQPYTPKAASAGQSTGGSND